MPSRLPHCLLWTQSFRSAANAHEEAIRHHGPSLYGWRFMLEAPEPRLRLEAEEEDTCPSHERAELLAVVRGLEALDQPSSVSLYTPSRFVLAGLRYGIGEWRDTNWHWEWYGRWAPVAHQDLWRRVEAALQFHEMDPRWWSRPDSRSGTRRTIRLDEPSSLDENAGPHWLRSRSVRRRVSRTPDNMSVSQERESTFPRFVGFDF